MSTQAVLLAPQERRAHERKRIDVFGRCLLSNGTELPCQTIDMSPGDVSLVCAAPPQLGERVIAYLDEFGRLEGDCARLFDGGFALVLEASAKQRQRIAAQIEWALEHHDLSGENKREYRRFVPREQNSRIALADGRRYPARIIDISLTGAAIALDVRPALGSVVKLAGMNGRVVRHFDGGVAIEFGQSQTLSALGRHAIPKNTAS